MRTIVEEIDLALYLPSVANSLEIQAHITPVGGTLQVYRSVDDDEPLVMFDGASTIMGVPEGRKLFVVRRGVVESYRLKVLNWFK